ncbi:MAG: 2-oxoacid:acceptor oxidoreductase family protein [Candidatus Omnitrophota bacterium]
MSKLIICAGFGGQGIMFMGRFLAYSAMKLNYNVTWISSYGAEARGGAAYCMVVISDDDIPSPLIEHPDVCIVMNSPSFEKFHTRLKKNGLLILNSSLIDDGRSVRRDITCIKIPMTAMALSSGNVKVANMLALGAFIFNDSTFKLGTIQTLLEQFIPPHRKNLLDANKTALWEGYEFAKRYKS